MTPIISPKKTLLVSTGILILIVCLASCSGCLGKIMSQASDSEVADNALENEDGTSAPVYSGGDVPSPGVVSPDYQPFVQMTPVKSEIVTEVSPIVTPDPYPILHGTRINETFEYRFIDRIPEFEKSYTFSGNATGLLVNVVEGPLYIVYTVNPQNDCMANPGSCRGDLEKPVQRPYLTITVRDNETQEIIAEDGYGGEYSSDTGDYLISITSHSEDGESTTTQEPGPRRIVIYREGTFHVTMEGNYLNIDLSIITGSSPDPLEGISEMRSGLPYTTPTLSPEEEMWW